MPSYELMNAPTARDQALAQHHRKFLEFLRPRVESDAAAEDILQEAYATSVSHADEIRDNDSVVAWFYQVLRNAVVDHYRRSGAEQNARARLERESEPSFEPELRDNVCTCVSALLPDLKPEYADIVKAVELDDRPIGDVALEKGLTANNATVRLHRARAALRRRVLEVCGACSEHGCVDCTCRQPREPRPPSRP
jgi:RNA polymerase sigma-70 factor (ECF subfamily)